MPGIYKIGMTDHAPSQRCEELSSATAVPLPFEIVCFGETPDAREIERYLHEEFASKRINKDREFFAMTGDDIASLFFSIEEQSSHMAYGDLSFLVSPVVRPVLRSVVGSVLLSGA
ncbi:MAG TPA: GIY-YIG nuclease family protein, partial [Woeseiaceae bacterium]